MVFPYRISPFCLLPNSSFHSFHQCRVVFPGIMSHGNLHPYQVSQGTLTAYSTVFQYSQRFIWLDLAVHMRMWWSGRAESLLTGTKCELVPVYFTFYFHIGAMNECVLSEFPIIRYVDSFCIQMSDVWCSFSFDQTGRRPVAVFYYLL